LLFHYYFFIKYAAFDVATFYFYVVLLSFSAALAMMWTVRELMLHPEHLATVNAEVDRVLAEERAIVAEGGAKDGDDEHDVQLYVHASEKAVFLEACFMEALRLHPSVPEDDREAVADDTLPDGTFVPKGEYCSAYVCEFLFFQLSVVIFILSACVSFHHLHTTFSFALTRIGSYARLLSFTYTVQARTWRGRRT
jgi:hypothetical protein